MYVCVCGTVTCRFLDYKPASIRDPAPPRVLNFTILSNTQKSYFLNRMVGLHNMNTENMSVPMTIAM